VAWEQLLLIQQEAAEEIRAELSAPPQACPRCGEPLREGPDGVLFCPFGGEDGDHYQWPRDGR
jgi:uncharacterized Zn finger protein (UPF0148 family)